MDFGFTQEQQKLIDRVNQLVQERIAPRAAQYDQSFEAPIEDVQDLHREGWLLANLDKRRGGLGYGLHGDDPLSFFLLDEHLAYGNPSTAHCFQVHNNALMMIDAMATDAQIQRWIEPTVKRGALIPGAGAEPHGSAPTTAKRVKGGYVVSGTKHYATNASVAEWLWIGRVASDSHPAPIMFMMHQRHARLKNRYRGLAADRNARLREPVASFGGLLCARRKSTRQTGTISRRQLDGQNQLRLHRELSRLGAGDV